MCGSPCWFANKFASWVDMSLTLENLPNKIFHEINPKQYFNLFHILKTVSFVNRMSWSPSPSSWAGSAVEVEGSSISTSSGVLAKMSSTSIFCYEIFVITPRVETWTRRSLYFVLAGPMAGHPRSGAPGYKQRTLHQCNSYISDLEFHICNHDSTTFTDNKLVYFTNYLT